MRKHLDMLSCHRLCISFHPSPFPRSVLHFTFSLYFSFFVAATEVRRQMYTIAYLSAFEFSYSTRYSAPLPSRGSRSNCPLPLLVLPCFT
ncbi:hypothetical protein CSUI_005398 [Cystoisospora suis]|uniref:Uncharacterized protein n=1 Tax=Cystoisospora suis TaxID=483139 RepID=A0A2C6KXQ9_9APIC|nr:hypothetical protein CSUI_005398 [Cystoisospora suis]